MAETPVDPIAVAINRVNKERFPERDADGMTVVTAGAIQVTVYPPETSKEGNDG